MFHDIAERLICYFWGRPQVMVTVGGLTFHVAFYWFLVGLLAKVAVHASSLMYALAQRTQEVRISISNVFPGLPTWWIPESTVSFVFLIAIGAIGAWLALTGKRMKRLYA